MSEIVYTNKRYGKTNQMFRNADKSKLIKYIYALERIIQKYDEALIKEIKEKELALNYINSPQFKKRNKKEMLNKILKGDKNEK